MRRLVALGTAALLLAAPAAAEGKPSPEQRQIRAMQRQMAAMQREIKALRQITVVQQRSLENLRDALDHERDRGTCQYVLLRDSYGGLFNTVGLLTQAVTGATPPAPIPPYDDQGACQRIGVTR